MEKQRAKIVIGVSNRKHGSIKHKKEIQHENLNKFLSEFNIPSDKTILMKQTHGNTIHEVTDLSSNHIDETDGIITNKKGIYLGVITADCVPVLLFDRDNEVVAAVHAGYRGLIGSVIENAIEKMKKVDSDPSQIEAVIGPAINVCCYSIDEDRVELFSEKFGHNFFRKEKSNTYLNLPGIAESILVSSGIVQTNIYNSNICTSCNVDTYYSYRADSDETFGQFVSVIGMV